MCASFSRSRSRSPKTAGPALYGNGFSLSVYDPAAAAAWLQKNADASWWPRAALGHVKQLRKGKDDGAADKYLDSLDDDHRKALRIDAGRHPAGHRQIAARDERLDL